ncbi:methyl-accepting chemotaxis protein, partial [Tistlia consotensis USBA 355]
MRITVKLKLAMAFGVIILLSAVTAVIAIRGLGTLNSSLDDVVQGPAQRVELSLELSNNLLGLVRVEKELVTASSQSDIERFSREVAESRRQLLAKIEAGLADAGADDRAKWTAVRDSVQEYVADQDKILDLVHQGLQDQAQALSSGDARERVVEAEKHAAEIVQLNRQRMDQAETDAAAEYDDARSELIGVVLIALLIAAGTGTWISLAISRGLSRASGLADAVAIGDLDQKIEVRSNDEIKDLVDSLNRMTVNLRETARVADTIADGDLTVEAKRLSEKDTLGIALERMLDRLRSVVAEALSAADNVSAGSQELSASAEELSQGAT